MKLLLYKDGLPVAIGRTRDVSSAGLFVQADYNDFGPQQSIEVELLSSQWTSIGSPRHSALIAHTAGDGFGLRFGDKNTTGYQAAAVAVERAEAIKNMPPLDRRCGSAYNSIRKFAKR